MHEFAIAREIWESVQRATAAYPASQVARVSVEIGDLTLIEDEQLGFWVEALAAQAGCTGLALHITHIPAELHCQACQGRQSFSRPLSTEHLTSFLLPKCVACGSEEVELHGGRDLRVVSAEIKTTNLC
jgi:hydrogenase nickel insertion protein HypA